MNFYTLINGIKSDAMSIEDAQYRLRTSPAERGMVVDERCRVMGVKRPPSGDSSINTSYWDSFNRMIDDAWGDSRVASN